MLFLAGDVSLAWNIWSFSAEVHLVRASISADGPLPASGVRLGRGSAQFRTVAVGDMGGPDDVQSVHLNKDASVSGIILQRLRRRCVLCVLDIVARLSLSTSKLGSWSAVGCRCCCWSLIWVCQYLVLVSNVCMTSLMPST